MYIHEQPDWPDFYWNHEAVNQLLGEARNLQGRLLGKMESLGFEFQNEAVLRTLTLDILKSSEIEGELLAAGQVRSSIARRLGLEIAGSVESDRHVEGVVDMMLDATRNYLNPLDEERLFNWHAALFPTGRSGVHQLLVANWRKDATGPMQVVSGPIGKERVHFQAPDSRRVVKEMEIFIDWFNTDSRLDPVIKAGIAHLWFVTIHPFEDGNGRIARALTDLLLARSDHSPQRFSSMSAQIRIERKKYYTVLEKVQKGTLDITEWILWFLGCLKNSVTSSEMILSQVLFKAEFWRNHSKELLNARQKKLLNKLLEGFEGNLTSSRWGRIAKCSPDTALRDIQDLMEKGLVEKAAKGGRSTHYILKKTP